MAGSLGTHGLVNSRFLTHPFDYTVERLVGRQVLEQIPPQPVPSLISDKFGRRKRQRHVNLCIGLYTPVVNLPAENLFYLECTGI